MSGQLNEKNKTSEEFSEILPIVEKAHENAFKAVNRELITMYWDIGEYISNKVNDDGWGKSIVKGFSKFIQSQYMGIKGFSVQNLWRMKQFYETYVKNEKLSTLSREISWSNVEYALSRSLSSALVADYQLHLPNKQILENKLRELTEMSKTEDE